MNQIGMNQIVNESKKCYRAFAGVGMSFSVCCVEITLEL